MAVDPETGYSDEDPAPTVRTTLTPRELLNELMPFEVTEEDFIQFSVMAAALAKFHERDAKHRGLWRYFGAIDSAHQLRAKATRNYNVAIELVRRSPDANRLSEDEQEDRLDDALDAINYAVFFVRNVQEGRYGS